MSQTTLCYCGKQIATNQQPHGGAELSSHCRHIPVSCPSCARAGILASQIARYNSAKQKHEQKKEECHHRLLETRLPPLSSVDDDDGSSLITDNICQSNRLSSRQPLPDPNQINQQVTQLKQRLDTLRSHSNALAVRVTAKTVENDEREARLGINSDKVHLARERLVRMRQCLLMQSTAESTNNASMNDKNNLQQREDISTLMIGGGLKDALVSGTKQIQTLRFHFACKVFDMHRVDVGEEYASGKKKNNESASGVGKIGGLPLPHAGMALYGVIPPLVLASSLRLVASLTQLVARCLGVVLPHPILVCFRECSRCGMMYDFGGDVIDVSNNSDDGLYDEDEDGEFLGDSDRGNDLCSACCEELSGNTATKRTQQQQEQHSNKSLSSSSILSSSTSSLSQKRSSLLSFVGSSARKAIAITSSATSRAITHMQQSSASVDSSSDIMGSSKTKGSHPGKNYSEAVVMSNMSISKRVNHASFAYLRESYDKSATEYVLNPPRWKEDGNKKNESNNSNMGNGGTDSASPNSGGVHHCQATIGFATREEFHVAEERFATGMQLLQNDVVALCFRAGVDVSMLWPAESMLLNLHSLWCHCQNMAQATSQ